MIGDIGTARIRAQVPVAHGVVASGVLVDAGTPALVGGDETDRGRVGGRAGACIDTAYGKESDGESGKENHLGS